MTNFENIKGVLFDLDGTLYRQAPLRALMAAELTLLPLMGPWRAPKRLAALRAYRRAQEALRGAETWANPAQAQIETAAKASGLSITETGALVDEWMMRRPLKYLRFCRASGLDRLLASIERAGLRMGVLSDYPATDKLDALGLTGRFSPVLYAGDPEIGALKPHPKGFLRACEIWKLAPADVLFVGDRPDVDAAGARAAGMRCAIVGPATHRASATYLQIPSLERLRDVLERA